MRWTLAYTAMTLCSAGVAYYSYTYEGRATAAHNAEFERAFTLEETIAKPIVRPHVTPTPTVEEDPLPDVTQLVIGATRDQMLETFGEPTSIDEDSDQWTYGSHIVHFKNDTVVGCVKAGAVTQKILAETVLENKITDAMATVRHTTNRQSTYSNNQAQRIRASRSMSGGRGARGLGRYYGTNTSGSARRGNGARTSSRYGFGNNNYYMGRARGRNQSFYRKPTLPRGMSPVSASRRSGFSRNGSTTRIINR